MDKNIRLIFTSQTFGARSSLHCTVENKQCVVFASNCFCDLFLARDSYAVPLEWIYYIHMMLHFLLYRYEYMNMNTFYTVRPTCSYNNTET